MKNGFVFNTIRGSVASEHEIVLQLYCVGDNMSVDSISAFFVDGNVAKETEYKCSVFEVDNNELINKCYEYVSKLLNINISIPSNLPDSAMLHIIDGNVSESDSNRIIYTCSMLKIRQIMSLVNYEITSITKNDDSLVVSGFAADMNDISFSVVRKKYKKEINVDYTLKWQATSDIKKFYPEYVGDNNAGFVLTMKNYKSSLRLNIKAGKRVSVYRFRGIKNYSRYDAINKASRYMYRGVYSLNQEGVGATIKKVGKRFSSGRIKEISDYDKWIADKMPKASELTAQLNKTWKKGPLFNVISLNNDANKIFIDSLAVQTYKNWRLCQGNSLQEAIADADGNYYVFAFPDMQLTPNALYECALNIEMRDVDFIYSDNDKKDVESGEVMDPHFKPDYNIDLLRSYNYIGYPLVVSARVFEQISIADIHDIINNPYNANLQFAENSDNIVHIAKILYRQLTDNNAKSVAGINKDTNLKAVKEHLIRCGISADVSYDETFEVIKTSYHLNNNPLISIIIPNKDHVSDLKRCMDSIDNLSEYRNYEYLIIENNSTETETFEFYKEISKRNDVNIVCWDKEFNYSAINNYGALAAKGEYLLLLNNDTEIINPDCLSQLLACCQREDVGITGARLYYEDDTIQHGGVIIGLGGIAGHAFTGCEDATSYMNRAISMCDYSAVTAACLMIKKSTFEAVNGLDEQFKVAFNDSDLCLKVRDIDKLVVYNPNARLYHYESKSRGAEDTPEKQDRFQDEIELFYEKWNDILKNGDPYYNINLSLDKTDFSLKV